MFGRVEKRRNGGDRGGSCVPFEFHSVFPYRAGQGPHQLEVHLRRETGGVERGCKHLPAYAAEVSDGSDGVLATRESGQLSKDHLNVGQLAAYIGGGLVARATNPLWLRVDKSVCGWVLERYSLALVVVKLDTMNLKGARPRLDLGNTIE